MNPVLKAVILIALAVIATFIIYVAICFIKFILEEIYHSFKNAKRSFKDAMWDLEWNLNYNKRHRK